MRGEGNHKIPGSFAPENMEKTGAERVKYSLACQHEDAIPIKFVSYAQKCPTVLCTFAVALRKESVDRNASWAHRYKAPPAVALRKESVDRNIQQVNNAIGAGVALRKESVDRNTSRSNACLRCWASLSARRAWIEISAPTGPRLFSGVALRKESVDRNTGTISDYLRANRSLSARRAWIEME